MIWRLLRRPAAFRADRVFQFDAAFGQRLAQQAFELGIDAPQIGRGRALDRRIEGDAAETPFWGERSPDGY